MNPITLTRSRWARWLVYTAALVIIGLILSRHSLSLDDTNGFDIVDPLVPKDQIHHGGPPRDGIPAIDQPRFVRGVDASFVEPDDRVLGLLREGVVRAYPIKILNYHEIVNDRINGRPVVITYCPLCGSGMAFAPDLGRENVRFGVSGLLYNSDMLLYDNRTESLWSQIMGMAISGKMRGTKLTTVPVQYTTWHEWLAKHPQSMVLSTQTGYSRNYDRHPYGDYDRSAETYFPVRHRSARYHPKERVIGLSLEGQHKAYPISELSKHSEITFNDTVAGRKLTIEYSAVSQSAVIYDEQQRPLPTTNMFWFAWYAFHPQTAIFRAGQQTD